MFDVQKFAEQVCDLAYPRWLVNGQQVTRVKYAKYTETLAQLKAKTDGGGSLTPTEESTKNNAQPIVDAIDGGTAILNEWRYHVQDILGEKADPEKLKRKPKLIVVTWALAGVDADSLDWKGDNGINFELVCNASSVRAINAFHWALMQSLQSETRVRLSALIGDVEEDEVIGRTRRSTGRAFRVFGMTVEDSIVGMSQLFEEVDES